MSGRSQYFLTAVGFLIVSVLLASCADQPRDDGRDYDSMRGEVDRLFASVSGTHGMTEEAALADRLEKMGVRAIPAIESYVQSKSPEVKTLALIALQRIADKRKPRDFTSDDIRRYLSLCSDADIMVRTYAMEALIASGKRYRGQILQFRAESQEPLHSKLDIVLMEIDKK